jgi:hypothetical protein
MLPEATRSLMSRPVHPDDRIYSSRRACLKRAATELVRRNNGAATSLHFPVAVMPERHANRLAPANISRDAPL